MKHTNASNRYCMLSRMPRNMLKLHGLDNVSEFVLHDLCCRDCFNMHKAAYFVDNPAFNCLKGIAGYCADEAYEASDSIWDDCQAFTEYMYSAPFNQKVRRCVQYSCKNCANPTQEIMEVIAKDLGMDRFAYCTWDLKHENHGYFIYEPNDEIETEELLNGLSLLGFCPIF